MSENELSQRTYVLNAIALLILLGATIAVAELPFTEPVVVAIALLIAGSKAVLVGVFFMHLKLVHPVTRIFAVAGVIWLAILIGLTLSDTMTRGWVVPTKTEPQPIPGTEPPPHRADRSAPTRTLAEQRPR